MTFDDYALFAACFEGPSVVVELGLVTRSAYTCIGAALPVVAGERLAELKDGGSNRIVCIGVTFSLIGLIAP